MITWVKLMNENFMWKAIAGIRESLNVLMMVQSKH